MEKHFFLLPPCAVVATTVVFQEKGKFSLPFPGFHIYFKIPIASLTLVRSALPWPAPCAALVVTITTESSTLLALPGFLRLGAVRLGHAKDICICIPPSKLQHDTTQRLTLTGLSLEPLGTCWRHLSWFRARGRREILNCPLVESGVLVQSPDAAFRPQQWPTQRRYSRISAQQRMGE